MRKRSLGKFYSRLVSRKLFVKKIVFIAFFLFFLKTAKGCSLATSIIGFPFSKGIQPVLFVCDPRIGCPPSNPPSNPPSKRESLRKTGVLFLNWEKGNMQKSLLGKFYSHLVP